MRVNGLKGISGLRAPALVGNRAVTVLLVIIAAIVAGGILCSFQTVGFWVIILIPLLIFLFLNPKFTTILFLCSMGFTEFIWIKFFGGYLKIFHILSFILLVSFSLYNIDKISSSVVFKSLMVFIVGGVVSILLMSPDKIESFRSFGLPLVLISIALNIGILLESGKINIEKLFKILIFINIVVIVIGLIQLFSYSIFGKSFVFRLSHLNQIAQYRTTSLFTEADTFGKFLSFSFLFLLPFCINNKARIYKIVIGAIFLMILITMTRSSWLCLGAGIFVYTTILLKKFKLKRLFFLGIILLFCVVMGIFISMGLGTKDILGERGATLVNPRKTFVEDGSVTFRIQSIELQLKLLPKDFGSLLFGSGWGTMVAAIEKSAHWVRTGPLTQMEGSGNIFINILYFNGILGLTVFLFLIFKILKVCTKFIHNGKDKDNYTLFAQGVLLSLVGMLVASQLASMWIAPEFWLVIGCGIFLEIQYKAMKKAEPANIKLSKNGLGDLNKV